jgi:hypothetical protein
MYPAMRKKHGYIWAFTLIAVTLYADGRVYKTERCSNTMLHKKVLYAVCDIISVKSLSAFLNFT